MNRPVCVLVGPPGSGKSTVGEALAERLGVGFRDVDADIARRAGKPIPEIFVDDGEPYFRRLEAETVAAALAGHDGVLALGGGAVMTPAVADALAGHQVVYLAVGLGEAVNRVGLGSGRPLLQVNPRAQLRHLMAQRQPTYQRLARLTVDTSGRDVGEVVEEIVTGIGAQR